MCRSKKKYLLLLLAALAGVASLAHVFYSFMSLLHAEPKLEEKISWKGTQETQTSKMILMKSFPEWYEIKPGAHFLDSCDHPCMSSRQKARNNVQTTWQPLPSCDLLSRSRLKGPRGWHKIKPEAFWQMEAETSTSVWNQHSLLLLLDRFPASFALRISFLSSLSLSRSVSLSLIFEYLMWRFLRHTSERLF